MTDTATPVPVSPPILKPGFYTSEAWITFLVSLPALILSSGLVANAPLAAKLVSYAVAAVTALGYMTNRTSLKRAHLAALSTSTVAPANANRLPTALAGLATAGLALAVAFGCSGAQQTATAVVAGGEAFLQCEGVDLTQLTTDVNGKTVTLLAAVSSDLVSGNYIQAIADLIGVKGANVVGCAVLAADTVLEAGKTSGTAALSPIELRAREMIAKYGWKVAPVTAPAPTAKPTPHADFNRAPGAFILPPSGFRIEASGFHIEDCDGKKHELEREPIGHASWNSAKHCVVVGAL